MTDCKTHYITKVVNVMKVHQKKMLNDYLEHGDFRTQKAKFGVEVKNDFIDTDYL